MRKMLSLLLTMAMLLSCLPMAAFAAEAEVPASAETVAAETLPAEAPAAAETEPVQTQAPEETFPVVELTGTLEGLYLTSPEIRMTASGISTYTLDDYGNPVLAGGNYASWYDRLGTKPAYAANFHMWLEEATDGDGMEDLLIRVENAAMNEFGYVHTLTSFNETVYVDLPYEVDEDTLMEACGQAAGEVMGLNLAEAAAYMIAVYDAFDRDHPEVFWLSGQNMVGTPSTEFSIGFNGYNWEISFIQEVCFILKMDDYDVRNAKYPTVSAINAGIARRDSAVNNILAGISASASVYDKVVYLNDWLTKHNAYNSSPNLNAVDVDCHKCLSGLEGRTGTNGPVCEGYARAFKVLCDRLGIGCVLVDGDANNGISTEPHMWNYVQMDDGKWYAVDVTWNDPVAGNSSAAVSGYECKDYLLVGAYTIVDDMPFNNSHPVANLVTEGGVAFTNGPVLASEKYGSLQPCEHLYDAPIFTWAADYSSCTASFTCQYCGDLQISVCTITSETTPATATQDGQTVYTATAVFGPDEFYDVQTQILPALGQQEGLIDQGTLADGKCSWKLEDTGVLTISGTGDMTKWENQSQVPWLAYADQITSVVIESGVKSIGSYAFYHCPNLTQVSIPNSMSYIYQDAFNGCTALPEIFIPGGVHKVDDRAFYGCTGLKDIAVGEPLGTVVSFEDSVFENCTGLTKLTIPDNVLSLGNNCFKDCTNLTEITFEGSLNLGWTAFTGDTLTCYYLGSDTAGWPDNKLQDYGGTVTWVPYYDGTEPTTASGKCGADLTWELDLTTGLLTISGTGSMNKVESMIYSPWYEHKDRIKKVVIEEGATSVGECMLSGLPNMAEVVLPDSLWYIDTAAFEMSGLTSIDLSSVGAIENAAFHGCDKLTEVTIPDGIELRGYSGPTNSDVGIFSHCTGLKKVTVGNFTDSGYNLFRGCTSLTEAILQEGMEFLGGHMFEGCTALTEVTIPNGTEIGGAAFSGCTALNTVNFGTSVGLVGEKSFENCTSLKRVDFPWVVGELYDSVFYGSGVTTIYFKGDAPAFNRHTLNNLKVTIYYPSGNSTWTDKVNGHFGANIDTWVPYAVSHTHSYSNWTTVTPSTCAVAGEEKRECAVCGAVETRALPLLEHVYTEEITTPTCVYQGWTTHTCSVCGYAYTDNYVNATGIHTYSGAADTDCDVCGAVRELEDTLQLPFTEAEWEVLRLTNEYRQEEGLKPLTGHALLQQAGDIRAEELVQYYSHTRPDGTSCFTVLDQLGISWYSVGENIAYGYRTPQSVVTAWMNSEGHRANILNPAFGHMTAGNAGTSWVQMFTDAQPYTGIRVHLPEKLSVDPGTTVNDLDLVAVLDNKTTGECYLPLDDAHCRNYDPNEPGDQTVTVSVLGVSCTFDIHVHDWQNGGCVAEKVCALCGETVGAPGSHVFGDWTVVTAATCTGKGTERRDCETCDHYETRELPLAAHTEAIDAAVAPTCTTEGKTEGKYCSVCGKVLTAQQTLPATGHSWDAGVITTQPTETTQGVRTYTCTVCGDTRTEDIPVLDHVHRYESAVTAPNCTEKGYTTHTCACGHSYTDSEVAALGHDLGSWTTVTAATCTEKGTERRDCSRCDHSESRDIAAKGHIEVIDPAVFATCTEPGLTQGKHCSVCDTVLKAQEEVPAAGHNWDLGQVTIAPTATEPGVRTYTCITCGEKKTEGIPATGATVLWGDVNGDGWVDSFDASLIMKYDVMLIGDNDLNLAAADVSGDGWVDSYDASLILKYDVMLITRFPVEE